MYLLMRHYKIIFSLLAAMVSLAASAQRVGDLFVTMPDSMIPYLSAGDRSELVGSYDADKSGGAVKVNALGDTTRIERLTSTFMQLRCNGARRIQLALLAGKDDARAVICVVNSYYAPSVESTIEFYDASWKKSNAVEMPKVDIMDLIHKPDSVSDDEYKVLCDMLDPQLVKYELDPDSGELTVCLSLPLVPRDKQKLLSSMLLQRKFKWDKGSFKRS